QDFVDNNIYFSGKNSITKYSLITKKHETIDFDTSYQNIIFCNNHFYVIPHDFYTNCICIDVYNSNFDPVKNLIIVNIYTDDLRFCRATTSNNLIIIYSKNEEYMLI